MPRNNGINKKAIGINTLNVWSNVSDIVIQYKLEMKYPKPNIHPFKKYSDLVNSNFFLTMKINKAEKVKKLIIKKLYGGRLKELNTPRKKINA